MNFILETGLIKIILKSRKDLGEIGDWRPIILLSQIYKLISGVIANRLKKLISQCQKAYQGEQNIGEILLNIFETISILNHHKNRQ